MEITAKSLFRVTLIKDDERTGFKTGRVFLPKGVYWQKKDLIMVGDKETGSTVRLAVPADSVKVEVYIS